MVAVSSPAAVSSRGDILLIGSGTPEHVRITLDMLRKVHPTAAIDLVVRPDALDTLTPEERRHVVYVAGFVKGRLAFLRGVRAQRYPDVAVVMAGDPGYDPLKAIAFACGARRLRCCNENGDAFEVSWRRWRTLARHILWRRGVAGQSLSRTLSRQMVIFLLQPVGIALLLAMTALLQARAGLWRVRHQTAH